jgi:hypothetical protein
MLSVYHKILNFFQNFVIKISFEFKGLKILSTIKLSMKMAIKI